MNSVRHSLLACLKLQVGTSCQASYHSTQLDMLQHELPSQQKKAVMILPVIVHDSNDERHILDVLIGDIKDQSLIICRIESILLYGRLPLFQPSTFTNQRCLYVWI